MTTEIKQKTNTSFNPVGLKTAEISMLKDVKTQVN